MKNEHYVFVVNDDASVNNELAINIVSFLSIDVGVNYHSNFYEPEEMNTGFEYTAGIGIAVGN